ncbi:P-loop containing nucleoside triphosphate hydrolase protein [Russula compacta]|nr:P-loop containing nucleoside triphosphate hydrolase protein [Russula compacta]
MLGGGIRVGMIWEFVGEGAAGKTQLALQLSLLVQLPVAQGGLDGSACYLTTSASLPTPRLLQLLHEHPLLARSRCSLDNIQTSATKSVSSLLFALSEVLPASINAAAANKARSKPLKLLIIDSLAELLLEDTKMSTATLADRSRNLSAIAARLHALATTHQLAVVAINRVTDVWDRRADDAHVDAGFKGELIYADHARIFGRAEGGAKSAALGLVWANQVNARIMLALTQRRHAYAHHSSSGSSGSAVPVEGHDPQRERERKRKRLRAEGVGAAAVRADDVVVRRLTVVFSSVCAPASVDFVVTSRGVETLTEVVDLGTCHAYVSHSHSHPHPTLAAAVAVTAPHAPAAVSAERPPLADVSPLDVGSVMSQFRLAEPGDVPAAQVEDDEDAYWREVDDFLFAGDNIDDQVQDTDIVRFS